MRPDPSLYLQHMSPCEYRGIHYEDPFWEDHLDKIFCENEALKRFFGLAIGLQATGYSHKSVFVAYGPASNNGKSVTFDAIREMFSEDMQRNSKCLRLSTIKHQNGAPIC